MKHLFLVLFSCISLQAIAQSITGKVVDESNKPVEYANILLLSAVDSSYLEGTISKPDGSFTLPVSVDKDYIIRISSVGYQTLYKKCKIGDMGFISINTNAIFLKEAVITASKPLFKQKNGTLITDVAGSFLSQSHNILDVLSVIPGMIKTGKGDLEVFGSGSPIIYINNRKIQDFSEVQQLDPKNIKTIELITNPGARYDASGNAILKITTINRDNGLGIQIGSEIKQSEQFTHSENIQLNYRNNKLNLSTYYDFIDYKNRSFQPQIKELYNTDTTYTYKQDQKKANHQPIHTWRTNIDYEFNPDQIIGFQLNGNDNVIKEWRKSILDYDINGKLVEQQRIDDSYTNHILFQHSNLFYNAKWNEKVATELNIDYVNNKNNYRQLTNEQTELTQTKVNSNGEGRLNIYSSQLTCDYKQSKTTELTWGLDYNRLNGNGFLNSDVKTIRPSDYEETEKKIAGFIELKRDLSQFNINLGLRYENMKTNYRDNYDQNNNINKKYSNLFPSMNINYQNDGWSHTLSFSSRTSRPSFRQLSNCTYYINEFQYQRGNPLLKPSNSYIIQYATSYKILNFNIGYTYSKDYISFAFIVPDINSNYIISTFQNYDHIKILKTNISIQKNFKFWDPSVSISLSKQLFNTEYLGQNKTENIPTLYINTNQYIKLPKDYLFSIYYSCCNGGNQGTVLFKPYQSLYLGLQKSFFHEKLDISLNANDLFKTMKYKEVIGLSNVYLKQTEDYSLWNLSINIIYRFNKVKTQYRGKSSIQNEINRL